MQDLCRDVMTRFRHGTERLSRFSTQLAVHEPDASLFTVREKFLRKSFTDVCSGSPKTRARGSAAPPFDARDPDLDMQGYREELKKKSVNNRSWRDTGRRGAVHSRWNAVVAQDGTPDLTLTINGGLIRNGSSGSTPSRTPRPVRRVWPAPWRTKISSITSYAQRTRTV